MHGLLESEGGCSVDLEHCWIASMLPLKSVGAGLLCCYLFLLFILDKLKKKKKIVLDIHAESIDIDM